MRYALYKWYQNAHVQCSMFIVFSKRVCVKLPCLLNESSIARMGFIAVALVLR